MEKEFMKFPDHLDDAARVLRAVNVVYFDAESRLCGDNTDGIGMRKALKSVDGGREQEYRKFETAIVVGAGGAARAAVYAVASRFSGKTICVLNRDNEEVAQLINDCQRMESSLVHIKTLEQTQGLAPPSQIVGSVPDFKPSTMAEGR